MKQFFKFMFASMLGFFLSFFLIGTALFIIFAIIIAGFQPSRPTSIPSGSVLEIRLDYDVPERTTLHPFAELSFIPVEFSKEPGLNDILKTIHNAKTDARIKGIYLDLNNFEGGGIAVIEAIRNELLDFKKSKKFVVAYGNNISQRAYYFGSVADKIFMSPEGFFEFRGLSIEYTFVKKTLNKLEIEPQIFKHGKYKSAVEPFSEDKMSEPSRLQSTELLNSVYNHILKAIEESRNIYSDTLDYYADNIIIRNPSDALRYKLIDSTMYPDQVLDLLEKLSGIRGDDKVNFIQIEDYPNEHGSSSRNRIAIVYAIGDIMPVNGDQNTIGIKNISNALKHARDDDKVKAVVFRVNSPGGDALTSDIIWREVELTRRVKPIIVSMGDVAASGGYYISCAADSIVAEPTTLTGSIGVFGIIPNMKDFFDKKLGITFDRVTTGKHSDFFTTTRPLNKEEIDIFQKEIDRIYDVFVKKVAAGRHLSYQQVDEIAQGRVWTGLQAKEIGLIDKIGGLEDAIKMAAKKARVSQYSIVEYPPMKSLFKTLVEDLTYDMKAAYLKNILGEDFKTISDLRKFKDLKGYQARMMYDISIQ